MKDPFMFWFGLLMMAGSTVMFVLAALICMEGWTGKGLWTPKASSYDIGPTTQREITEEEATKWALDTLTIRDETDVPQNRRWYRIDGRVMEFDATNKTWVEIRKWDTKLK